eukprot:9961278-Alexandrium_andersonii.AAC.1
MLPLSVSFGERWGPLRRRRRRIVHLNLAPGWNLPSTSLKPGGGARVSSEEATAPAEPPVLADMVVKL